MKANTKKKTAVLSVSEKRSVEFLMEKMGVSKKEIQEISRHSGVPASKMIELMQLSKYEFVNKMEEKGRCKPCANMSGRIQLTKFW
jgi:hypothetical protein